MNIKVDIRCVLLRRSDLNIGVTKISSAFRYGICLLLLLLPRLLYADTVTIYEEGNKTRDIIGIIITVNYDSVKIEIDRGVSFTYPNSLIKSYEKDDVGAYCDYLSEKRKLENNVPLKDINIIVKEFELCRDIAKYIPKQEIDKILNRLKQMDIYSSLELKDEIKKIIRTDIVSLIHELSKKQYDLIVFCKRYGLINSYKYELNELTKFYIMINEAELELKSNGYIYNDAKQSWESQKLEESKEVKLEKPKEKSKEELIFEYGLEHKTKHELENDLDILYSSMRVKEVQLKNIDNAIGKLTLQIRDLYRKIPEVSYNRLKQYNFNEIEKLKKEIDAAKLEWKAFDKKVIRIKEVINK